MALAFMATAFFAFIATNAAFATSRKGDERLLAKQKDILELGPKWLWTR
jgi:hypothetical protein